MGGSTLVSPGAADSPVSGGISGGSDADQTAAMTQRTDVSVSISQQPANSLLSDKESSYQEPYFEAEAKEGKTSHSARKTPKPKTSQSLADFDILKQDSDPESKTKPHMDNPNTKHVKGSLGSDSFKATRGPVRFGNLYIREYERTLGDTPCSGGPPISIGWKYRIFEERASRYAAEFTNGDHHRNAMTEMILPLENYEKLRGPRTPSRDLILSRFARESLLIESGVSRSEMAEAVRQNIKLKNQRRQTVTNLAMAPVEEKFEKWARSFKKLLIIDATKREKAKSRYLFEEWLDESSRLTNRHGSNITGSFNYAPTQVKGILKDDTKLRRRETM